ncbi:Hypothetical protein POVN_LOCUS651 [uncultured virus]|nr:Hypothetical protein POVN_LOCUS651 [uncultured virus]
MVVWEQKINDAKGHIAAHEDAIEKLKMQTAAPTLTEEEKVKLDVSLKQLDYSLRCYAFDLVYAEEQLYGCYERLKHLRRGVAYAMKAAKEMQDREND